jgi:hypothetical protein
MRHLIAHFAAEATIAVRIVPEDMHVLVLCSEQSS